MALTRVVGKCGLCHREMVDGQQAFMTSGEFLPRTDPLRPLCGQPLHWECYAAWPERGRFARAYVQAWQRANARNPFWWTVLSDDCAYVAVNPQSGIEEASLRLLSVGSDIRVPLPRWAEWLADPARITPHLHPFEAQALAAALPGLRSRFPDALTLVDAIDPREKRSGA